ncbi:hypothetical protein GHT06_005557 [Daphnia sinensis]|uniref:Uncharacterized protein n=1 Tax=Daphnia sinensis TaxID=1820382 RepID=A0AAD5KFK4_9CRUS|nr:hypothetical protein GHT06_005557 [Daphnia sinensis]
MYHITDIKDACFKHSSFRISHILFIGEALPGPSSELANQITSRGSLHQQHGEKGKKTTCCRLPAAISHFCSTTGAYFHLHPEFVTAARDETGSVTSETAKLGAGYHLGKRQPTIPPLSIAAGIDFGVPSRIRLPPLRVAEQYVISRARLYASVIKLSRATSVQRHTARQGHAIAFPQPESAELVAEQARATGDTGEGTYPRADGLPAFISIAFIGAKAQWDALLPNRFRHIHEMDVRKDVVFSWLRALKHLNHFYANITIDDTPEMEASLEHIVDDLIKHARVVSDDVGIAVDRLATAEREQPIAPMHRQEPEEDMELPQGAQLPAVFLGKSAHPTSDRYGPSVQVLQSLRDTLSSGPATSEGSDSNGGGVEARSNFCLTFQTGVGSLADPETQPGVAEAEASAESHEPARIDIPDVKSHLPMCEFEGNDRLLYSAFPFLFLLGSGLRKPGSVAHRDCRHMLLQLTCNFATCHRFLFCLFDQLQRHAAARAVSARFKNNPESLEKLQAWVADPTFLQDLARAARNPQHKSARALVARVTPHIKTTSSTVPYSSAQRKASMQHLYALAQHFSMPSLFLTYTPDFASGVLNLRLSLPLLNNIELPASDDGILEALRQQRDVHQKIRLCQACLNERLASNPAAMAEFLVGLKPEGWPGTLRYYHPESRTFLDCPLPRSASWRSRQESAAGAPRLLDVIASLLDRIVTAELEPKTIAHHLLSQFTGTRLVRVAAYIAHCPVKEPREFAEDNQRAASFANLYSHSATCHKGTRGKICCRLGLAFLSTMLNPDLLEQVIALTDEQRDRFLNTLAYRNGMVVEFNPVMTALLGCNSNVSILGSDAQAKANMCYLLKYIIKPPCELSHTLALIHNARRTVENFPSTAKDTGTERRTAMHFLTRVVNQLTSTVEVSAPVASLALLGMPSEICSHGFHLLFVHAALAYVLKKGCPQESPDAFDDLQGNGLFSDDEPLTPPATNSVEQDEDPEELLEDDQGSKPPYIVETSRKAEAAEDDYAHVTATVYSSGKEKKAVTQVEHYAYRGETLLHYSPYDYAATILIVQKPLEKGKQRPPPGSGGRASASSADHDGSDLDERDATAATGLGSMQGRTPNATFSFHPAHPLYDSHHQQIRSKFRVPVLIRGPPKPPPPKPTHATDEWRRATRAFTQYMLLVFRPWLDEGGTAAGRALLRWTMRADVGSRIRPK